MEYLTAKKLQHRFGLSLMDAERIVKEQTSQALYRHPLPVACWFTVFTVGFWLPGLLPSGNDWNIATKAAALLLLPGAMAVARLVKHDAILDACRRQAKPPGTGDTTRAADH